MISSPASLPTAFSSPNVFNHKTGPPSLLLSSRRHGKLHSGNLLVQRQNIRERSHGRDGQRVDLRVAAGVMVLDVREVGGLAKGLVVPVQIAQPGVQTRVARADVSDVALEMLVVDGLF